jgi:UDP-2,4-diacetamido-2,4,6-trideoxy-beta-L-altropyranose hydrolase
MKIVFRVDASSYIGNGHVMRCLVLAEALNHAGHQINFSCRCQKGDLVDYIRSKGFLVNELVQPLRWKVPVDTADYQAWLQVSWQEDANNFIAKNADVELVVVDHYGIGLDWEALVKNSLKCKIFAIDDLVREHHVDLVLDQTLSRTIDEYLPLCANAIIITGCEYALLNPLFAHQRKNNAIKKKSDNSVLLSMGGVDQPNATLAVLNAFLNDPKPKPKVTVLLSPKAPHYNSVKNFSQLHSDWVTHIDFVDNMAAIMLKNSVAIGAPGSTSWERACLGIPSIIVPLAENQKTISQNLVRVQAVLKVNLNDISTHCVDAYHQLLKTWDEYHKINLQLCDGLGLHRVVHKINGLFDYENQLIRLRKATKKDIKLVFDWQCQAETRKYALNSNIPTLEEHSIWMNNKLAKTGDIFYILELRNENKGVGVVRLDNIQKSDYVISIFVDSRHYGKGIAKQALAIIDIIHPNITINATVLKSNLASQKLFTTANYQRVSENTFVRSPII